MFVPALATAITLKVFPPAEGVVSATSLRLPRRGRRLAFGLAGFSYPVLAALIALPLGMTLGVADLDIPGLSGVRHFLSGQLGMPGAAESSTATVSLSGLAAMTVFFIAGLLPCFGEEWGWRGYLMPKLLPWGLWPALLFNGLLWALWHVPLLLRGFNFDDAGVLGIVEMSVSCMLSAIILGWLDLKSGSVWPAVIAHSANNSFAMFITTGIAADTSATVDPLLTDIPVWITTAGLAAALAATGRSTTPAPGRPHPPEVATAHTVRQEG
ncbi:CPBP family intramembrane glutamic endopeptidase [Actinorhabdospora filicis]|nr:type II CAAX endopeptidase family protein [Actinorhabdospora filicis]